MPIAQRLPALALALLATCASGATVTGISPVRGSLAGGTRLTVWGSGFGRDGKAGQTLVFIGNDLCRVEDYDSTDEKLTCWTPGWAGSPADNALVDVRVAIVTIGEDQTYAACRGACPKFNYRSWYTPYLDHSSLGGSAGDVYTVAGRLFMDTTADFNVAVLGDSEGKRYASCDVNEDLYNRPEDIVDGNGNGVLRCYLGNIEAGRYNVSLEVRDVNNAGYGQAQRRRNTKVVAPSPDPLLHHFTQVPRITGLSYNAAGLNGGDDLVISGSGFSVWPGNNVVTLPGGVPCNVTRSTLTSITCTPLTGAVPTQAYNASIPAAWPAGTGLVHTVYRNGKNVYGRDPATSPGFPTPDETYINANSIQGRFIQYGNENVDSYSQMLTGLFVPRETANYSFYCQGDDNIDVWISTTPMTPGQPLPRPTRKLLDQTAWSPTWWGYVQPDPIFLQAGQRYPIRISQVEGTGGDFLQCGLRVHLYGDTAPATADLRNPLQAAFKSMPSVQRLTLTASLVREVQRITVTGAVGGKWTLTRFDAAQGKTLVSDDIQYTSSHAVSTSTGVNAVATAVSQLATGCSSISVSRVAIPRTEANVTGFSWDVTFNCPTSTIWPTLSVLGGGLTRDPSAIWPETVTATAARVQTASTPIDGAFRLTLGAETTAPVNFNGDAAGVKAALLALPSVVAATGDIDVTRAGGPNSPTGDYRDGSVWTITFWAPQGLRPALVADASAMAGPNTTVTTTVIEAGSWDPWYAPLPVADWFELSYPRPTVSVVTNGILAGCNVLGWNASGYITGDSGQPQTAASAVANPCGFEWVSSITPTVTGISPTTVTVGTTLTITGTGFLPASAGVGIGPGGSNVGVAFMNSVLFGTAGACAVTSVAADGTSLTCVLGPTGANTYAPTVIVREGRGIATADPSVPTVEVQQVVSGVSPLTGSIAGGTLLNITGSGFRPLTDNVITIGGVPCVPVSLAADFYSMLCRTGAATDGTSGAVVVNAKTSTFTYTYALAQTPELVSINRRDLSAATSGVLMLTVTKATAAAVASARLPFEVLVDGRVCTFVNVSYAAGGSGGATVACRLIRKPGYPTLPQAPAMPLIYVPPFGYAAPPSTGGAAAVEAVQLDTGYRIHSVSPPVGSAHGGTLITIAGVGLKGSIDQTRVEFFHTGPGTEDHAQHAVTCNVQTIAADGTAVTCLIGQPDVHHQTGWLEWGNDVVGTLNLTMNKVRAPCGRGSETAYNASACRYAFSPDYTPEVTSVTWDEAAGTVRMTGEHLVPPMHVYFGDMDSFNVTVSADYTVLTATIPPQVAGVYDVGIHSDSLGYGHIQPDNSLTYTYTLMADMPTADCVSPWGASTAGGHLLVITGKGFCPHASHNLVRFVNASSTALSGLGLLGVVRYASPTRLVVATPAVPGLTTGTLWASINITVMDMANRLSVGTVILPSALKLNASNTPVVTAISPASGSKGTTVTITGSGFGGYVAPMPDDSSSSSMGGMGGMDGPDMGMGAMAHGDHPDMHAGSIVFVGGAPCANAGPQDWSNRQINCTLGETPAGTHLPLVTVPGVGLARLNPTSIRFTAALTIPARTTGPLAVPYNSGLGGGVAVTITGSGFASAASGGSNNVMVCDSPCTVTGVSYNTINCTTGGVLIPAALNTLKTHGEHVITGRGIAVTSTSAANIAAAFDGDVETGFTVNGVTASSGNCWIGLDVGANSRATLTRVRWYSQYTRTNAWRNGKFEASNDGAAWTVLATVGSSVQEGWTYIELADTVTNPVSDWTAQPYYRYMRFRYDGYWAAQSGQGCVGQELQFIGHTVAAEVFRVSPADTSITCPINVTVTGPSDPFIGGPSVVTATPSGPGYGVVYDVEATAYIETISPNNGTALGGTLVTLTGRFPSATLSEVDLRFNGVPCSVVSVTATVMTCYTGARDMIRPPSVFISMGARNGGIGTTKASATFKYLDRWSSLNTWADDEPPLEGDTVIVPAGQAILVDISPPQLFLVLVQGEMVFDRKDLTFDASYILVHGGRLEVGTEADPFLNKLTITLHGDRYDSIEIPEVGAKVLGVMNRGGHASHEDGGMNSGSSSSSGGHSSHSPATLHGSGSSGGSGGSVHDTMSSLGMMMSDMPGADGAPKSPEVVEGVLEIHGKPRKRVWTKVAATIPAGSDVVTTAEDVDFQPGEIVVITTSSYNAREAEEKVVAAVLGPRSFRVTTPFVYLHESTIIPAGQYGHSDIDARCEVGLLSRNVVIQGDDTSDSQVFGVHTIAAHGGVYHVENVELRRCGQQGQLGRYCTHQHMRGNAPGNYVRYNSIHHSYQRASTIHATNYATVKHNFAYHIVGHSIFVEDGVEKWNVIEENLVALTLACYMCLKGDMKPANFWAASATNIWRHNVAAGCDGGACNGYWHELPGNPHGPSYTTTICPVSGPLGEFFNNTARASVKGIRIYPVYLPYNDPCAGPSSGGFPVYYVNNTFIRNRDNGIFTKRGGDIHHINPKVVETAGDDIHWTMLSVGYGWNPHIKNALIIGNTRPTEREIWGKAAIQAPQDEFFYVSGATIVNYDSNVNGRVKQQGALAGCASCETDQFMKQGGYTYRWERLAFINTSVRVISMPPFRDIFYDLDGTLTGFVNGTTTPYWAWNDWPECPRDTSGRYAGWTVCDGSTRVRRISIDNVLPRELPDYSLNMNISQWAIPSPSQLLAAGAPGPAVGDDRASHARPLVPYSAWHNRAWDRSGQTQFRPRDSYGWVFTLVTGRRYNLRWQSAIDVRTLRLRYSEPEYLVDLSGPGFPVGTGEWTGVGFRWIDQRYRNRVLYQPAIAGSPAVEMPTASSDLAIPAFNAPFGSGMLPNGNKTWHTILNANYRVNGTDLNVGSAWTRANVNSITIDTIQCPPNGCVVPSAPVVTSNWTDWSLATTWPSGRVPREGEDVTIWANMSVRLDTNPPRLGRVTIEGRLIFGQPLPGVTTPRRLEADAVVVWGELTVGTAAEPYNHSAGAEILLNGVRSSQAVILDNSLFLGNKNMVVLGKVSLAGRPVVRAWTRLNVTAQAGSNTIRLTDSVNPSSAPGPNAPAGWNVGDRIVISPTEYTMGQREDQSEIETASIMAISADGRTLTLDRSLLFRHFAGFASTTGVGARIRLAAAVGLLSGRSVVIRGNTTGAGDRLTTFEGAYGGHVYVGIVTRQGPINPNTGRPTVIRREGTLDARWVEFATMGKGTMEHAALNFQYGSYDLDPSLDSTGLSSTGAGGLGRNSPSTVLGCSFSNLNNYGLVAFEAAHLTLDNNVWHAGKRSILDFDAKSINATITNNLIIGSFRSPDTGLADQYPWVVPQATMQLLAPVRRLWDNYVAGSIDIGYSLRPLDCSAATTLVPGGDNGTVPTLQEIYRGNEAVSTTVGVFILPTALASGCGRVNGFTVWKSSHLGIVAVDGLTDLTVSNAVLSDNHIGISLNFVQGKRGQSRSDLVDSVIMGSTAATVNAGNCSASVTCRAYTSGRAGTLAETCGSVFGSGTRRVGYVIPQYTNRGKTCAVDGGLDVCRPPNRPERLCSMPWEKKYGLPSTRATHAYLNNVAFASFAGPDADCGRDSHALVMNPSQDDMGVPVTLARVTFEADSVPLGARFSFAVDAAGNVGDDDAHNLALIVDNDGQATGVAKTSILGSGPLTGLPPPGCFWRTEWKGQECPGVLFRQAIFESLDRDRGFRKLGSLLVTRTNAANVDPTAGSVAGAVVPSTAELITSLQASNRTSLSNGPNDDMCAMRFYFAQYPFLVRPGAVNHLLIGATHPQVTRLHFFSPDPSESAIIRMHVQRPNSQEVWVNGVKVEEKNAATATDFPTLADPAGTFLFDPQDKYITLTVKGGLGQPGNNPATYDIIRLSSVQLNFKLAVDVNTFFSNNPQILINNLAMLLKIDESRIKIVSVHPGSTNVGMEILPPANATAALLAAANNATESSSGVTVAGNLDGTAASNTTTNATNPGAGSSNSTAGAGATEDPAAAAAAAAVLLDTHAVMTNLVATIASLAADGALATVGGYAVQSLAVIPPPAPTLGNSSLTNSSAASGGTTTPVPIIINPAPASSSNGALDKTVLAGAITAAVLGTVVIVGGLIYASRARAARISALTVSGKDLKGVAEGSFAGANPAFNKPHARVPFPPATTTIQVGASPVQPARVPSMSQLFPGVFGGPNNASFRGSNPMGQPQMHTGGPGTGMGGGMGVRPGAVDMTTFAASPRASTRMAYGPSTAGVGARAATSIVQPGGSPTARGAWGNQSAYRLDPLTGHMRPNPNAQPAVGGAPVSATGRPLSTAGANIVGAGVGRGGAGGAGGAGGFETALGSALRSDAEARRVTGQGQGATGKPQAKASGWRP